MIKLLFTIFLMFLATQSLSTADTEMKDGSSSLADIKPARTTSNPLTSVQYPYRLVDEAGNPQTYNDDQFAVDFEMQDRKIYTDEEGNYVVSSLEDYLPKKCFEKKGLTWWASKHNCKLDITRVSCSAGYGDVCNPYSGDTKCYMERPILCIKRARLVRPPYSV